MDLNILRRARPLVAQHLTADFGAFCRAAWTVLHPGTRLSWTPAHDLICDYLTAVYEKKITRLIVNCPPRFAKSSIVTILFPIWVWLHDASKAFLCCSYEIDLAVNHNQDRRRLMASKWFKETFADRIVLSTDRSQAGEFGNTAGGIMQAASTASKAQGRGGDYVVCDDPISGDVIYSESFRREVNFWFENQLPQRLNNPSESAIIVVAQRLHQDDPCGFLLAQPEGGWVLLKLPLVAEQDETYTFPHSGKVWKRKKGDCLDPRRWSARAIKQRQQNRLVWAGQFQQEPASVSGNVVRTADILFFGGRDPQTGQVDPNLPESFDRKVISVDCSFKDLSTSDFVAVIVVGIVGARRYVLHVTNAHLDLTGTENEIRNCHALFGPISATLVESAANGASVVKHLQDEIAGVVAINPEGGKMARLVSASPEFQAHNWYFDRNGIWTHKLVEQLTMFPNCRNDDLCDAVSQCSVWLQSNSAELGMVIFLKEMTARIAAGLSPFKPKPKPVVKPIVPAPLPQATSKPAPPPVEPCPVCGSTCTMPIGSEGGPIRCANCGSTWRGDEIIRVPTSRPPGQFCDCDKPDIYDIPGGPGARKCRICGAQNNTPQPIGMTRREYMSGNYRRHR